MIKHRFKTREEFIDEFGYQWKDKVNWNNKTGMDYLLGTQIIIPSDVDIDGFFHIKNTNEMYPYNRWCISTIKMLKEINVINYNEKKVLVYD